MKKRCAVYFSGNLDDGFIIILWLSSAKDGKVIFILDALLLFASQVYSLTLYMAYTYIV